MAQIDWKQFNEFFQYYDKEIITLVINIYIEEYDERMSTLEKNILDKDLKNLKKNSHSFKGVVLNFQAPYVAKLLQSLEDMAEEKQEEHIPETFEELKKPSKELLNELVEYLKTSHLR
ncbi:MAG: Hpt domain-containing protein [Mariniphaga sp.]